MAKIVTGTTTGATPSLFRKTSACRSLFGEIDHEEVRRDLNQEMDRIYTDDQERWNFNFREGTPLQGRYTWQEMTPETDSVPKPYENLLARLTATVVVQRIANTASESSSSSSTETTATTQSISTQTDCDIKPVTKKNPVRSSRRFRVDTTKLKQSKLSGKLISKFLNISKYISNEQTMCEQCSLGVLSWEDAALAHS